MELTEDIIRARCVEGAFFRGKRFFKNCRFASFTELGSSGVEAEIEDSADTPRVRLDFGQDRLDCQCSCNNQEGDLCRHIVATALAYIQKHGAAPVETKPVREEEQMVLYVDETLRKKKLLPDRKFRPREGREGRERPFREHRERPFREGRNGPGQAPAIGQSREPFRGEREPREFREHREPREPRENRLPREREHREFREHREREGFEPRGPREERHGHPEGRDGHRDREAKRFPQKEGWPLWKAIIQGYLSEFDAPQVEESEGAREDLIFRVFTHQRNGLATLTISVKMRIMEGEARVEKSLRTQNGRLPRCVSPVEREALDFIQANQSHDRRRMQRPKKMEGGFEDRAIQSNALHGLFQIFRRLNNCYAGYSDEKIRIIDTPLTIGLRIQRGREGNLDLIPLRQNDQVNLDTGFLIEAGKPWITDGIAFQEVIPRLPVFQLSTLIAGDVYIDRNHLQDFYENFLAPLERSIKVEWAEGLDLKPVKDVPCQPVLILIERKRVLYIHLSFRYGNAKDLVTHGDRRMILDLEQCEGAPNLWLERDREAEDKALKRLLKFNLTKSGDYTYTLEGDPAFDFLFEGCGQLKKEGWDVKGIENLKEYSTTHGYPEFHVVVKSSATTIDLSWRLVHEGNDVPLIDYWKAFRSQQYSLSTPHGQIRVNEPWFKRMEDTFHDLFAVAPDTAPNGFARLNHYQASIIEDFIQAATTVDIDDTWRDFSQRFNKFTQITKVPVPETLKGELREYQHQGFNWLCFLHEFGFSGILADDMGLGKTLQTLTLLEHFRLRGKNNPCLVIAPTSVTFNWIKEAARFYPELKVLKLTGKDRKSRFDSLGDYHFIVTNYTLARIDQKALAAQKFHYVILDEAHQIKNPQSQTAIAVRSLQSDFRLALTGTPMENHLGELWSQFHFLMPGFLGSNEWFDARYRKPIEQHQNRNLLKKLNKRISPFILRRLKKEVAKDLPEKSTITLFCEMETGQRAFYKKIQEKYKKKVLGEVDKNGIGKSQLVILDALLKLRQAAIHPNLVDLDMEIPDESTKMDLFKDMVQNTLIPAGHRALVFSQFTKMLGILKDYLDAEKIKYCYLDGSSTDREQSVESFQQDESVPIFLISLKAGGVGLNLTGADYVIHMDPWWNPAVEEQANDRAYRIGQSKHVFVYKLVAGDSIEEKILKMQETKRALFDGVIGGVGFEKSFTREDLVELFS